MNVVWIDERTNEPVVENCKHRKILPSNIKLGDYVLFHGELVKVHAIQRDCPRIENLSRKFTQFTFKKRDGSIVPCDSLYGPRDVYRKSAF